MPTEEPRDPSRLSGETMSARPEKTNWKPVYAAIAVVVAISIITVLWINRPATQATNPPPSQIPSPSQPSASTPAPTPSPSPTLDEREVAIAEAKEAYEKYTDAYWTMVMGGSSVVLLEKVHAYTTGRSWQDLQDEATQLRKLDIAISGKPKATVLRASKVNLEASQPTLQLDVCIDETQVEVIDADGKKLNSSWIRSKATLVRDDSSWKLSGRSDMVLERSCLK